VFGFFLSGLMTLIVSAITTVRNLGFDDASVSGWLGAFISAWPVSFPTVLAVAPLVRRIVAQLVVPADAAVAVEPLAARTLPVRHQIASQREGVGGGLDGEQW
jgi:hypothetical protein